MDHFKLVSVIVPIFNEELWIERCVRSILDQSYKKIELILVDDGSTDRTKQICGTMTDDRISYFRIQNLGVSGARNYGLRQASGEYVLFVDGDDYIHRDMIGTLVAAMESTGADISKCRYAARYKGNRVAYSTDLMQVTVYDCAQAFDEINYGGRITASVCDAIFKKDKLDGVFFPSKVKIGEDYTFFIKVLMHSKSVVAVPDVLYSYTQNSCSATHQGYTKESYLILDNYIDTYNYIKLENPQLENGAYAYLILQEMAIIVSMIKAETYDNAMIEKIRMHIRHGLKRYVLDGKVKFYLKCCALMISAWPRLFIFMYRLLFKESRDMQTIKG